MKEKYDKRHNVKEPDFQISQKVLLLDRRIKADSNRVLTHKPYIIKDVIQTDSSIGPAYKLVHDMNLLVNLSIDWLILIVLNYLMKKVQTLM